jgi:hypothetical protein
VLIARANTALSSPVLSLKVQPNNAMAWCTGLTMLDAFGRLIAMAQSSRYFTRSVEMSKGILTEVPTTVHEVNRDLQGEGQN